MHVIKMQDFVVSRNIPRNVALHPLLCEQGGNSVTQSHIIGKCQLTFLHIGAGIVMENNHSSSMSHLHFF